MPMQELDYDHTMHDREFAGDDKMVVYFFPADPPLLDEEATQAAGHKKFRDAEMIYIAAPGAKNNIIIREAREDDKIRFAAKYAKFKQGLTDEQIEGFPLKEWTLLSRSMVEELKYQGFRTVEQLANASDAVLGKYPGMRELAARAKTWLASQKSTEPLDKLHSQVEQMAKQFEALKAQNDELVKELAKAKGKPVPA